MCTKLDVHEIMETPYVSISTKLELIKESSLLLPREFGHVAIDVGLSFLRTLEHILKLSHCERGLLQIDPGNSVIVLSVMIRNGDTLRSRFIEVHHFDSRLSTCLENVNVHPEALAQGLYFELSSPRRWYQHPIAII